MSEITKLYENAGIKPEWQDCCKIADKYWANNTESGFEYLMLKECPYNQECTDECEYAYDKIVYPPFTAEKQIELICFLLNANIKIDICKEPNMKMEICDIAEALAEVTNTIWQDLTEEERKQIKNILQEVE